MPEPIGVFFAEVAAVRADQVLPEERPDALVDLAGQLLAREGSDRGRCEHLPDDRGALQHRALDRGQAVESRRDQCLDRRRHLHLRQIPDGDPSVVLSHEMAVVDQHRDHLLDEQGVAFGSLGHARRHVAGGLRVADQIGDQLDRLGFGQRLQQDRRRVRDAAAPAGPVVTKLGPRLREDQDRGVPGPLGHVLHEIEERRLGPLEIVEEQEQRLTGGEDLEEPSEGPERLLDGRLRPREADEARHEVGDTLRALARPDHGEQFPLRVPGRVQDREPGRLTHDLDDRPERDALPVGEAPSTEDGRVRIDLGGELLHEPRLPGTGRSQDREEMAGAIRRDPLERLSEQRQLAVTADHRRVEPAGVAGGTGRDVLESVRGDRLRSCLWPRSDPPAPP